MSGCDSTRCMCTERPYEGTKARCGGMPLSSASWASCLPPQKYTKDHHAGMPGKDVQRNRFCPFRGRCNGTGKVLSLMFGGPALQWQVDCCCDSSIQCQWPPLHQSMPSAAVHGGGSRQGRAEFMDGKSGLCPPAGMTGWGHVWSSPGLPCHPLWQSTP